ncbi:MAG: PEP-CTERM sorting domain-containing protein [Pseudomonadota bacterium]
MKLRHYVAPVLCALAIANPASAVILTSSSGNAVTDYSAPSLVSFDLDLATFSGAQLNFIIEEGDLLAPVLNLNAIVRNLSGSGLGYFSFSLGGISFAGQGSVTPAFGTIANVSYTSLDAGIRFGTPEFAEFHFGNPFEFNGLGNWQLDVSGLEAGDTFSIRANIPEPETLSMFLASLALFAVSARGRKKP